MDAKSHSYIIFLVTCPSSLLCHAVLTVVVTGIAKSQSILFFWKTKFEVQSSALRRLSILVLPKTKLEVQTTNQIPAACI